MPQQAPYTLSHFAFFGFQQVYWTLSGNERADLLRNWLLGLYGAAQKVEVYQVFPTEAQADFMVWSTLQCATPAVPAGFFEHFARLTSPYRACLYLNTVLWGYTRQSQYTRSPSNQELNPLEGDRKQYLTIYPFVKTTDWYLMSRESRQGMMNEHIRIGKQYADIRQLLLYSSGLQDQEFVVVYEMDDLTRFSDLVNELRSADGRRYTLRDSPLHLAIYHPAEETLALWR